MAKFYGIVGFSETKPISEGSDVWDEVITERPYYGDILKVISRWQTVGDKLLSNLEINHRISIIADAYANEHFFAIKYIDWMGSSWNVTSVEVERPRLILAIGGVYNGPKG